MDGLQFGGGAEKLFLRSQEVGIDEIYQSGKLFNDIQFNYFKGLRLCLNHLS